MDRAIRLLLALEDGRRVGVRDLAREIGMAKTTVGRLLADYEEAGLVSQDADTERYRLGPRVVALASAYLERLDVRSLAIPIMTELRDSTKETVGLMIREGKKRICVASVESRLPVRSGFRIGDPLPMHAGAAAKVLLAFLKEESRAVVAATLELSRLTEHTITEYDVLMRQLEDVALKGYAISTNEVSLQSASVSAPVFNREDEVEAALVITGPTFRVTEERMRDLVPDLVAAANRISSALGTGRTASAKVA